MLFLRILLKSNSCVIFIYIWWFWEGPLYLSYLENHVTFLCHTILKSIHRNNSWPIVQNLLNCLCIRLNLFLDNVPSWMNEFLCWTFFRLWCNLRKWDQHNQRPPTIALVSPVHTEQMPKKCTFFNTTIKVLFYQGKFLTFLNFLFPKLYFWKYIETSHWVTVVYICRKEFLLKISKMSTSGGQKWNLPTQRGPK